MNQRPSLQKRQRPNLKSGLYTLRKAVAVLGSRALPSTRTALGRELAAWRAALIADLGGEDAISTQQRALIEKAVTQKLICDSLDAYVLQMESLVNKRSRVLWPVVRERTAQVALLQSILRDLGLERRQYDAERALAAALASLHAPLEHAKEAKEANEAPTPAEAISIGAGERSESSE
jgi:hypothetical protein